MELFLKTTFVNTFSYVYNCYIIEIIIKGISNKLGRKFYSSVLILLIYTDVYSNASFRGSHTLYLWQLAHIQLFSCLEL